MTPLTNDADLATTSGVIALANLQAQIDGLEALLAVGRLAVAQRAELIDLLTLRGQILGCSADYERAAALAEQLVQDAPFAGSALLARVRTHALFHRFTAALADLDVAEQCGSAPVTLDAERAVIFQALGRYDEALALCQNAVASRPDFASLSALAVLQAERGEIAGAERLFSEGRRRYRGVSPFPVALIDFQRGLMWRAQGDLKAARTWFDAAQRRVPAYAAARDHLAEVDAALAGVSH
ncbi:MAG: hypothetical protein DCC55_03625 [Chloroflexi bacterium]|nr:MAG: hypothetical protein DCC55_03625 [Chloroflexota bacterium]